MFLFLILSLQYPVSAPSWKFEYLSVHNENQDCESESTGKCQSFQLICYYSSKQSKVFAGEFMEGFTFSSSSFDKKQKTPAGFCFSRGWQTPLQCPCPPKQSRRKQRAENKQVYTQQQMSPAETAVMSSWLSSEKPHKWNFPHISTYSTNPFCPFSCLFLPWAMNLKAKF